MITLIIKSKINYSKQNYVIDIKSHNVTLVIIKSKIRYMDSSHNFVVQQYQSQKLC